MNKTPLAGVLAALIVCALGTAAFASGGSTPSFDTPDAAEEQMSPEQEAAQYYQRGLQSRDRAWKLERKIETFEPGEKRAKLEKKLAASWKSAIRQFEQALGKNPVMYQAFSSLGYALRRTGDYSKSLEAYNRALALSPDYLEAIEYRAEAYLGLNRIEEAKQSYIELFARDRKYAGELMQAMKTWIGDRREDAAGVDPELVAAFEGWVAEREEIAGQTASKSASTRTKPKKDW